MYFPPSKVKKTFTIEREMTTTNGRGGQVKDWVPVGTFEGCLVEQKPDRRNREGQEQHPSTHTVLHQGPLVVQPDDRLALGTRKFIIRKARDVGEVGMWTGLEVEERKVQ